MAHKGTLHGIASLVLSGCWAVTTGAALLPRSSVLEYQSSNAAQEIAHHQGDADTSEESETGSDQ